MKNSIKFASIFLTSSLIITPVSSVVTNFESVARAEELTKINKEKLNTELSKFINDKHTINNLINKFENNIPWDNMSGKIPVKEEEIKEENKIINKKIFEDGSFIIKEINLADAKKIQKSNNIQLRAISGGTYSSGSGWMAYKGVSVSSHYGGFNYGFTADYEQYSNGNGQITNVYSPWQWGFGTFSNHSLYIGNPYGNPAHATYSLDYSAPGGWFSKSIKITLYVNGSSAWDDDN